MSSFPARAVVDQTITGLAQGRRIEGKVLFLGGPLYFFKALQREFVRALGLSSEDAVFPDMGRYAAALKWAIVSTSPASTEKACLIRSSP